jgi:hypothetical protein
LSRVAAQRLALAIVITLGVLAGGLTKVADLDFWWHLKAGELIVKTHSIPAKDVFSDTAFGREYVDHEWLFQAIVYFTYSAGGPMGIALLKCLLVALTLLIVAFYAVERGAEPFAAGGLVLLALAGGITRMIERPELFSTLFAVVTFVVCDRYLRTRDWRVLAWLPVLCAVWANVHAAVIIGLIIQLMFIRSAPQIVALFASIGASCLNPFGDRVLTVPFELTRIIDSGVLNNEEWRHPTFQKAPFYFVALGITILLLVAQTLLSVRRQTEPRQTRVSVAHPRVSVVHLGVALFFAYLSLKYIRNVGLFCTFMPMLVAAEVGQLKQTWRRGIGAIGALSAVFVLVFYFPFERGFGEASYFPDRIAQVTRERNLRGHMLNSYSFGGYLIWKLWPQRRVFIDGRNEVYLPLLERLKASRDDSRAWDALLRDYQIEYALLEYVDDLDRVTQFDASGKATTGFAPLTATRFPRSRWALVYWDDDGMVLVKRGGVNSVEGEYDAVFPEGIGYQRQLVKNGTVDRARAIAQLQRKLVEDPNCHRARVLLAQLLEDRRSRLSGQAGLPVLQFRIGSGFPPSCERCSSAGS